VTHPYIEGRAITHNSNTAFQLAGGLDITIF